MGSDVTDCAIASIVDRVLPMTEAAEAHRLVESEARRGASVGVPASLLSESDLVRGTVIAMPRNS